MNENSFSEPVILNVPGIGTRIVASSFEAIECLVREWPEWARERSWQKAYVACRDALDGWRPAAMARRRFVQAAKQVGFMPRGDRPMINFTGADFSANDNRASQTAWLRQPRHAITNRV